MGVIIYNIVSRPSKTTVINNKLDILYVIYLIAQSNVLLAIYIYLSLGIMYLCIIKLRIIIYTYVTSYYNLI